MTTNTILSVIAVMAGVTFALRLLPFVFTRLFQRNTLLRYMGDNMPIGIMLMLALYTVKDKDLFTSAEGGITLICMAIAVFLYWYTNNALIAIFTSLGGYLLLVNIVL